jgi:hypothetical protein
MPVLKNWRKSLARKTSIRIKLIDMINCSSFMVIAQPHSGVNPVLVCERREGREGSGTHVAKVSVIIVSLLHDFMQTHPNTIELDDIGK